MPLISVFYCPKANALVRGANVIQKVLPNQMIEAIGECPLHKDEMLRVVHYPDRPFSKVGTESAADDIPTVTPPVNAGTAEQPSSQFTDVFWRTVRKNLPLEQKEQAIEIATVLWEEVLSKAEKAALLDAFATTGKVPYHHSELEKDASTARFRARPMIAVESVRTNPEPLKQDDLIEKEIIEHELVLTDLLERFEAIDSEAAQPLTYNLPMVARIIGDERYLELLVLQNQKG